jgi:4-hydroxy 2-oxovalerate aldolase
MVIKQKKSNFKILDCTLRDGGYVNDFNFGEKNIHKIVNGLYSSNVDIIELGFLTNDPSTSDRTIFNSVSEAEKYVENINTDQEFCLMIRPDWYDISKLEKCTGKINTIRFAFHYEDLKLTLQQAEIARLHGYEIFFNPVNVLSYSENELKELLGSLNEFKPKGIYIVDTFGSILPIDLQNIFLIFDNELDKDIALGLHLHENLSISLALAINFIDLIKDSRPAYIDSSILGMGRIPGNLCTELIMNYLNLTQEKQYNLEEIYQLIDNPISEIKKSIPWGYMPAYAITAFNKLHRSYAEYLMEKSDLTLKDIDIILNKIKSNKDRENFNKSIIEKLYNEFLIEFKS